MMSQQTHCDAQWPSQTDQLLLEMELIKHTIIYNEEDTMSENVSLFYNQIKTGL